MLQQKTRPRERDLPRRLVGPIYRDEILLSVGKLDQHFLPGLLFYGKHLPSQWMRGVQHGYLSDTCF